MASCVLDVVGVVWSHSAPPPPPNLGFVGLCLCLSASLPVSLKWREGVWEHLTMRVEGIARGRRPGVSPWAR